MTKKSNPPPLTERIPEYEEKFGNPDLPDCTDEQRKGHF